MNHYPKLVVLAESGADAPTADALRRGAQRHIALRRGAQRHIMVAENPYSEMPIGKRIPRGTYPALRSIEVRRMPRAEMESYAKSHRLRRWQYGQTLGTDTPVLFDVDIWEI